MCIVGAMIGHLYFLVWVLEQIVRSLQADGHLTDATGAWPREGRNSSHLSVSDEADSPEGSPLHSSPTGVGPSVRRRSSAGALVLHQSTDSHVG